MDFQELMDEIEVNEQMEETMAELKQVLMERDGLDVEEAEERIAEAQEMLTEMLADGDIDSAYNICEDMFGLEPDYLEELMF